MAVGMILHTVKAFVQSAFRLRHRPALLVLLFLLCLPAGFRTTPAMAGVTDTPRKVLVLHSYHSGLSWTDSLVKGINEGLTDSGMVLDVAHEFMDSKRIFSDRYLEQLADLYALKFGNSHIDVILATDDLAFNFLRNYHDRLFPGKPVVFCGVNSFQDAMLAGLPTFTGVLEAFDMPATLETALQLQPQADRFVVISDQTLTGTTNKALFLEAIQKLSRPMDVLLLENHSMDEVRDEVSRLDMFDVAVWLSFTTDRLGNYYDFRRSATLISEVSRAPLYSFWDFHLGYGIAGGKLASGYYQGLLAARLAVRILGGEPAASIAVVKESPNRFMFDFRELQRFNIDPALLPADSVVVNRPVTLYSQYKTLVLGVVGGFFALTAIIALLLVNAATRRKANREISTAKDRFQKIFDNAAVVLFEVDFSQVYQKTACLMEKGVADLASHFTHHPDEVQECVSLVQIADCNRAALTLYGAETKDELLQAMRKALQVFSGADLQWMLIALMNKETHLEWETVCTRLDGEIIHVLMSLSPDYQTGADRTLIVSAVDITERKRFLEALSLSENRFRTLFDSAASGIALVDLDGRYLRVNDAFCLMLGSSREELENSSWQEVTYPDDIERTKKMIAGILANQPVPPMEKRYLHSDGQVVWALTSVGLNTDRDGGPLNYVSQMQDITLMKKVQAEMQQSEARYRRIFEADLSGFYLASPSGKVLLCNQIFAGILGLTSAAEAVGRNISTFYRKTDTWSNLVGELADGMKVENTEVELLRGDGETVTVLCNSIGRFDEHGRLVEVQGHMMDISRQKTLETQLVRAQKMEVIGLMAGGVAHDLNNILSGIINYPELMLATLDQDSHLRKPLESVRESGQRAATVVADLLTVARSAANVREPHNVLDLVREYLDSPECSRLCSLYPKITIQLECRLADGIVLCSPVHIRKCLMNLVTNAMEAIEDQGQVLIVIREETVMDEDRGGKTVARNYAAIEVTDNGPGISEKDRERIFEPFYTKKIMGKSGTGLGLAVVWNTVQEHGGRTIVASNERGTTFSLYLPRYARPGLSAVKEKAEEAPPGGGEHVLVVDDEPVLRDIAEQILTFLGYRVDVVGSGEEALAFVQKRKVDLVLLDMFMEPGMNGRLTYERIIEMYPGQKAIIVSGFSKSDDVKKALRLGVGSFIEKPYSAAELGWAVYRELHGDS